MKSSQPLTPATDSKPLTPKKPKVTRIPPAAGAKITPASQLDKPLELDVSSLSPSQPPAPIMASSSSPQTLPERLDDIRTRIAAACAKAGRDVSEVTLIAVTKAAAPEAIREAISLGVADLGENRVQQLAQRAAQINEYHARLLQRGQPANAQPIPARLRWHMIGHLQRNKVKQLLPLVSCIHSIDSLRLAEEIDIHAGRLGRKVPVMLQVNASEEPQKYGVAVGAAVHLGEQVATMPNLQLVGLMSMAALDANEAQARFTFSRTREIFEEMKWHKIGGEKLRHLSMGMSNDFEAAILEGATMIRVGTTLFGASTHVEAEDEEG